MQDTSEQLAFIEAMACGPQRSIILEAVAGSGKTRTLERGARRLPEANTTLACAFNKRIERELAERLPPGIDTATFNAMGHRAWGKYLGRRLQLDSKKMGYLTTQVFKDWGMDRDGPWQDVRDLAKVAKSIGLVPKEARGRHKGLVPDSEDEWRILASHYDVTDTGEVRAAAREVLLRSINQALRGEIDFDDQLYMPVVYGAAFNKYDIVIVDEAQDLSTIQHRILRRSLKPGGKIVAAGDSHQAIYGFRGATADSMEKLAEEFGAEPYSLTYSFRCPKQVVAHAQRIVPHMKAPPEAAEGSVSRPATFGPEDMPWGTAILCRNNAPLLSLSQQLLAQGIGCRVLGREIGQNLIKIINKLTQDDPLSVDKDTFLTQLSRWEDVEKTKAMEADDDSKLARIEDQASGLRALAPNAETAGALVDIIHDLFEGEEAQVTLSTAHKAKGLEWSRVFFLDPWRIPSKFATQPWQLEQEDNIEYVLVTRALQDLIIVSLDGFTMTPQGPPEELGQSKEEAG